jgi:hypothetical protein
MLGDKSRPIARGFLSLTEVTRQRLASSELVEEKVELVRGGKK